jgi:hypothetical protein
MYESCWYVWKQRPARKICFITPIGSSTPCNKDIEEIIRSKDHYGIVVDL